MKQFAELQTKAVIQEIRRSVLNGQLVLLPARSQDPFDLALGEFLPNSTCHSYHLLYLVSYTGIQSPLPVLVSIAVNSVLDQLLLQFSMDKAYLTGLSYTVKNLIAALSSPALIPFLLQLSIKMKQASTLLVKGPTDQAVVFKIIVGCCVGMDKTHVQEFVDCVLKEAGESVVLLDLCRRLVKREGSCITGIVERVLGMKSGIAAYLLMEVYSIRTGSCAVSE
jgi:hypothetical protein